MKLAQYLSKLSYSQLSDLAQAGQGNGTIVEPMLSRVLELTNDGLLELHTKFALLKKELILQPLEGTNRYYLRKEHAMTDTTPGVPKYIMDSMADPFLGDLIRIDQIMDVHNKTVWTNDPEECGNAYRQLAFDTLYVQNPTQVLKIFYRAKHAQIPANVTPATFDLVLPPNYEQALRYFVSWKVYSGMKGQDFQIKAQQLELQYQNKLNDMVDANITGEFLPDKNERFENGGWC